ncbi:hypothetical protein C8F01DRAFT_1157357 [Mycena amicta]|nr:hypothetical protein C8F01DRAFT_1157357 [Mycena amicta]
MLPFLLFILVAAVVEAASDPLLGSWRKPNITTSLQDRVSLAQAAINEAVSQLDATNSMFTDPGDTYSISGALYSQLAEFDQLMNQSNYVADLEGYYASAKTFLQQEYDATNFTGLYINDGVNFGHGAIIAYKTYNISVFLQYAIESWWAVVPYTLTQAELDAGQIPTKSFSLTTSCQGITMAGGTFWSKDLDNPLLVGLATGSFMVLSALLAEVTSEPIYLTAALQSMSFIHAHLYNVQNVVQDLISGRANDSCSISSVDILPYNSGLMIEGLSVLYSISGNASYVDMIGDIVTASISTSGWQGNDGIIETGVNKTADAMLPRGLATAYRRNATTPAIKSNITSYLAVQYNAAVDLAKKSGSDIYGQSWLGPAGTSFNPGAQVNAIQALLSGVALGQPIPPPSFTSSSSAGASSSTANPSGTSLSSSDASGSPTLIRHKSSTGAIAGGIIGGMVILIAALVFLWRRRRLRAAVSTQPSMSISPTTPRPFDFLSGYTDSASREGPSTTMASLPHGAASTSMAPFSDHSSSNVSPFDDLRRPPSPSPSNESWAVPPPTLIDTHSGSGSSSGLSQSPLSSRVGGSSLGTLVPLSPKRRQRSMEVEAAPPMAAAQPTTEELVRILYQRMNPRGSGDGTSASVGGEEPPPDYRATLVPPGPGR